MEDRLRSLRIRFLMRQLRYDPADIAGAMVRYAEGDHAHRFDRRSGRGHTPNLPDWPMPQVRCRMNGAKPLPYGNL